MKDTSTKLLKKKKYHTCDFDLSSLDSYFIIFQTLILWNALNKKLSHGHVNLEKVEYDILLQKILKDLRITEVNKL